jgi:hypothetical protein
MHDHESHFCYYSSYNKIVEWYRYMGIVADIRDAIDARHEPRGKHKKQNAPSIIEKDSVRR